MQYFSRLTIFHSYLTPPDTLAANQQSCNTCSSRLTNLERDSQNNIGKIRRLELDYAVLRDNLDSLESTVLSNSGRISSLESQLQTERSRINNIEGEIRNTILPALTSLRVSTERLESINKIWKNNFKNINATFGRLKQKVSFKPAVISYYN
jgi:chromosome segregation ATPase